METKSERQFTDFSFARVLVVDDMPSNRVMAAGLLKKYKIQVDCVNGGRPAFDLIESGSPAYSAVFMDHLMPDMDGMETVRRIRNLDSEYAKNIPIIAMTGDETAGGEELFLKNGFQVFIAKPLTAAKLDTVLQDWIKKPAD